MFRRSGRYIKRRLVDGITALTQQAIQKRQQGSAMTEFIVSVPLLLALGLGSMQTALMYQANNIVSYAAFEAARKGATNHADPSAIKTELGKRIAPLFGGDGSTDKAHTAILRGMAEAYDPRYTRMRILNPTQEAFAAYGIDNLEAGAREIPNSYLQYKSRSVDADSKVSLQDANLLRIEVTYAYKLSVPLVNDLITNTMAMLDSDNARYYLLGRIPITSVATVRMQTPARLNDAMVSREEYLGGGSVPPSCTEDNAENNENCAGNGSGDTSGDGDTNTGGNNGSGDSTGGDGTGGDGTGGDGTGGDGTGGDGTGGDGTGGDGTGGDGTGGDGTGGDGTGGDDDDAVECESTWEDERYTTADVECDGSWWCSLKEKVAQVGVAANVTADFFDGFKDGLISQAEDLWELIKDPSILLEIAEAFVTDPVGTLKGIVEAVVDDAKTVMECGPVDLGRIIGENVSPAMPLKIATKLAKLTGNAKLQKYVDDNKKDGDGNGDDDGDGTACDITRRSSFVAGTKIATPHGPKNIEDIQVGDSVYARSVDGFENSIRTVTQTVNRDTDVYVFIFTEFGFIKATPTHPFWVQGKGWTDATDIKVDDYIATREGDAWVNEVDRITNSTQVYNFSVDQDSTYFAGPGELWVHNACKVPTADEIRDALGTDVDNYYIAKRDGRLTIIRRQKSPDIPQVDYEVDADGQVKIIPKVITIDFEAKPISRETLPLDIGNDDVLQQLERDRMQSNRDIDLADEADNPEEVNRLNQKRISESEQIGEHVAYKHFDDLGYTPVEELAEANRKLGNGKQGEFDMAFVDGEGNLVIVEAKGGNSQLGSRKLKYDQQSGGENIKGKRAQQGTSEYLNDIISNYEAKLGEADPFVRKLRRALRTERIRYVAVRQPLTSSGALQGSYKVTEFQLNSGT